MIHYKSLRILKKYTVYEPGDDSVLAAKHIPKIAKLFKAADVLDMGTGTGILGLTASTLKNVRSVTFADINQNAVDNAKDNARINVDVVSAKCKFINTDLFSKIKGKFDLVIFNAPYLKSGVLLHTEGSKAWEGGRKGIEVSLNFLGQAKKHIKKSSRILIVESSLGSIQDFIKESEELGYKVKKIASVKSFLERIFLFSLELSK
ncbi:MAG: HemK2/MTQ2 family protein methyltransferase [Candidatus Micrarchaeales archaeon]